MLKIDGNLQFLRDDRFSRGNSNMAKIYECFLSTNILREKRRDSFDFQRENLLGEESICMANLIEIPRVIVFVLCHDCLASVFFRREVLFCQASIKIKTSPLSLQC